MDNVRSLTPDLSHDEVQDLLGAYALHAVEDDEARAVRAHLSSCPKCAAEFTEHLDVVAMLADSGGQAPGGLWDRIESNLVTEPPPRSVLEGPRELKRRRRRTTVISAVASAAALIIVALLGATAINQRDRVDELSNQITAAADDNEIGDLISDPDTRIVELDSGNADPGVRAVVGADGRSFLVGDGLEELGADQTYQLWGRSGDEVVSLALLGHDPSSVEFWADHSTETLMITREVATGVTEPTETSYLRGTLPKLPTS